MEEDALSTYPLAVNKSSLQIEEVLSKLMSGGEVCNEHKDANSDGYCDQCNIDINAGYDVTVLSVLGELIPGFVAGEFGAENDLHAFKKYIEENFDDEIATVGTANMDFRSLEHNFETNVILYGDETAAIFRNIFERDMADSESFDMKRWKSRLNKIDIRV